MSVTATQGERPGAGAGRASGDEVPGSGRDGVMGVLSRPYPISIVMVLVPVVVGGVKVLASVHQPFVSLGDVAIIESAIRDSVHGHQLLGPYSRFGWFHPGPAYFYLLAPVYWALQQSARSLFAGAFFINTGCALAAVAVIRRHGGEWAARWGAVVVGGLLYFTVASTLWLYNPWNPAVLALPLLLVMVLAASSAGGSTLCLLWAVLVGTFVAQTDLGTVPTVAGVLVVGAVLWGWHLWRTGGDAEPRRSRRHLAALAGVGLLIVAAWVPPLLQQTTHNPGNMSRIATFFEHPPGSQQAGGDHSKGQAVRAVAEYATTLPLKSNPFPCCSPNEFAGPRSPYVGRLVGLGVGFAVGLGVVIVGWRRRHRLAMSLGAVSVVGTATAVVSAMRVVGPLHGYLLWWTAALLVPAWVGAGILAVDWLWTRQWQRFSSRLVRATASGVLAIACAVPCLALAWSLFRQPPAGYDPDPQRQVAAQLVERPVRAMHVSDLRVQLADPTQFALASAVVIELQKAGVAVHLEPPANGYYGPAEQVTGHDQALLVVSGPQDASHGTSTSGTSRLGSVEGAEFWLRPLPAG